jgi:hypothetical protein
VTKDLDLVRDLLARAEQEHPFSTTDPKAVYHIGLMRQAGLVQAMVTPEEWRGRFTLGILKRLTPDGRQFLQAAKNETIWRRAKHDFVRPGLFFSLRLVSDYLRQKHERVGFGDFTSEKSSPSSSV